MSRKKGEIKLVYRVACVRKTQKGDIYLDPDTMLPKFKEWDYAHIDNAIILRLVGKRLRNIPHIEDVSDSGQTLTKDKHWLHPNADYVYDSVIGMPRNGEFFITGETNPPERAEFDYRKNKLMLLRELTKLESRSLVFTREKSNDNNKKEITA